MEELCDGGRRYPAVEWLSNDNILINSIGGMILFHLTSAPSPREEVPEKGSRPSLASSDYAIASRFAGLILRRRRNPTVNVTTEPRVAVGSGTTSTMP